MATALPGPTIWAFTTSRLRHVFSSVAPAPRRRRRRPRLRPGLRGGARARRARWRQTGEPVDALVAAGANGAYLRDHAGGAGGGGGAPPPSTRSRRWCRRASSPSGSASSTSGASWPASTRPSGCSAPPTSSSGAYVTPEDARAQVAELAAHGVRGDHRPRPGLRPGRAGRARGRCCSTARTRWRRPSGRPPRSPASPAPRRRGARRLQRALEQLEPGVVAVDAEGAVRTAQPGASSGCWAPGPPSSSASGSPPVSPGPRPGAHPGHRPRRPRRRGAAGQPDRAW